jgi:hypothetical protein
VVAAAACGGLALADGLVAIVALALVLGCANAVIAPAEFALVPAVSERVAAANARMETARYIGYAAGPLLGGVIAAGLGTGAAMLVDAATFLALAGAAVALHARRRPEPGAEHERAREGIAFLMRDPTLALVMVIAFVSLLFMTTSVDGRAVVHARGARGRRHRLRRDADRLDARDGGRGGADRRPRPGGLLRRARFWSRWPCRAWARAFHAVAGGAVHAARHRHGRDRHGVKNVLVRNLIHEQVPERLRGRAYAGLQRAQATARSWSP